MSDLLSCVTHNFCFINRWTDQTPVDFDFWGPNEPNDYFGSERCTTMARYNGNRKIYLKHSLFLDPLYDTKNEIHVHFLSFYFIIEK